MAEVIDRDQMSDEELEEERRRRLADLTAPTRLAPVGHGIGTNPRPDIYTHKPEDVEAPDVQRLQPVGSTDDFASSSPIVHGGDRLTPLGYKDRQRLPTISADVPAGSAESYRSQIQKIEDQRANPWGSAENHPGRLGKVGHVLGRVANIAGDILAPVQTAMIPGSDLNRAGREREAEDNLDTAAKREEAGRHNVAEEDIADRKGDLTDAKNRSDLAVKLRKYGLTVDDAGKTQPIGYADMSPTEQAAYDLKQSQGDAAEARALLDHVKANPNSPQNAAIKERLRIMAQNATTAAGKLGLDGKKFLADYYGMDEQGNALAGVQKTDEGTPIGPKISGANRQALSQFNKDYAKPSEDTERSYQMYQEALRAYESGDTKTGAATMLALSQHIGTTFGQTKGSRQTRDLIVDHKDAIGVIDKIDRYIAHLTRGDELSASQMKEFGDLISNFRHLSWQTAVKEAKRARLPVDFLPADLQKELGGATRQTAAAAGGGGPQAPAGKTAVVDPSGAPHFVNTEKIDSFLKDPKYKGWKRAGQ